jgi:hypothetical protein
MRDIIVTTPAEADTIQSTLFEEAKRLLAAQGYNTRPDGSVIGRNALTGEERPDAVGMTAWAEPEVLEDDKLAIPLQYLDTPVVETLVKTIVREAVVEERKPRKEDLVMKDQDVEPVKDVGDVRVEAPAIRTSGRWLD